MKDTLEVGSVKVDIFLKKRNKVLMSFFFFFDGIKDNTGVKKINCKVCGNETNIQYAQSCFGSTYVLQYQASQSQSVCIDMNGLVGPSGSYPTVSNWLASQILSQYHSLCLTAS